VSFSRKTLIIDCGASRTVLGVFSQRAERYRLENAWVEPFAPPEDFGERWLQRTVEALGVLRRKAGRGGPCVLVLPGHLVLTKFFRVPRASAEQRQKVIQFESEQNLPIALSELVWDSVVSAERAPGLEVMLAASHLHKVEALCRGADAAGFAPRLVLPGVLALLAAARAQHADAAQPAVVINVGARSTTCLFLEHERFLVRTFTYGLLTAAVDGTPPGVADIANRVSEELSRTVQHFRRQHGLDEPARIYLAGGGARIEGLASALAVRAQRPVDAINPWPSPSLAVVAGKSSVDEGALPVELVGALLAATRESAKVINLLPPGFRRHGERRRRRVLAVAAAALVALAASLFWPVERPAKRRHSSPPPASAVRLVAEVPVRPVASPVSGVPDILEDEDASEEPTTPSFELVAVRAEPYRLQLAGYVGGPDHYRAVLTSDGLRAPLVAEGGRRLDDLDVELRTIEVRKVATLPDGVWPAFEVAAFATLHDERTGEEVELDSRVRKMGPVRAWLRTSPDERPRPVRVGDELEFDGETFVVTRIQADPPEVVVSADDGERDDLVLLPVEAASIGATERPSAPQRVRGVAMGR
jgi:Tfp pilus assembly PilM family ATPase